MRPSHVPLRLGAILAAALVLTAHAAPYSGPQALTLPAPIPAPKDVPYPGTIRLFVDATDVTRHIFRVRETIPVEGGKPLTLLFPKWLPGDHKPDGPLPLMAGLVVTADGQRVEWTRDPVEVFAFHLTPPAGAKTVEAAFQFVSPVRPSEGRMIMTPEMLNLQWNLVSLYPAGFYARRIPVEAEVTIPDGWRLATALETADQAGATTRFKTVPYETLIDSPIFAGRYFKQVELDPGGPAPVRLNVVADRGELLDIKPAQLEAHKALVSQAYKLFGAHHYDHYDFLVAASDRLGGIGLEHHRSSEDSVSPDYFTAWDKGAPERDLLPHEFTHSWNGKFRRPADLWTPEYLTPMRDSLLWVYEGQTQYWGFVLSARSGLLTKEQTLDAIALTAAAYDNTPGRAWKALQDTTNDPISTMRAPIPWRSWQRSEDYYSEGELVWLDVDTLIRERSKGARSLDDFAHAFFGIEPGSFVPVTYTFEDVVKALNAVEPYDWAGFLRQRLDGHGPGAPLDGITRGGYRLTYTDTPSDYQKQLMTMRKGQDLTYSLGLSLGAENVLTSVLWEGPAFKAGLTVGNTLVAVNGIAYDADRLKEAITAAKTGTTPIELLIKDGDHYCTVAIAYHEGLRYPHLEKVAETPSLDAILAAR